MGHVADLLRRQLTAYRDAAVRTAQSRGLAGAARIARLWLDVPQSRAEEGWSPWEYRTLDRLLERMCRYPDGALPRPADTTALESALDFASTLPEGRRRQLRDLLALFEAGSMLFGPDGEFVRFTELSGAAADAYLRTWSEGLPPLRGGFHALKSICMMGYWNQPETWGAIGYSLEANPGLDHP